MSFTQFVALPVELIDIPKERGKRFDPKENEQDGHFSQWLSKHGKLITPIAVRKAGDRWECVIGRRRLLAAKYLGWESIDCRVEDYSDKEIGFLCLMDNLYRHDLKPAEKSKAIQKLVQEWEFMMGPDPGNAAGGLARVHGARRDSKGRLVASEKAKAPTNVSADIIGAHPASEVISDGGPEPTRNGDKAATPRSFATLLSQETGQTARSARTDLAIAKNLTEEQLTMLGPSDITQEELLTISKMPDTTDRDRVVNKICSGMDAKDAIAGVAATPGVSIKNKAAALEKAQTDEEWLQDRCGPFREKIQDTTWYDQDALLYRHTRDSHSVFRGKTKDLVQATRKKGYSPFAWLVERLIFICHPNDWYSCEECFGKNVDHPNCDTCKGTGYRLKSEPPRRVAR
jgi:hypothetical protein